jgi:hypothetical protein
METMDSTVQREPPVLLVLQEPLERPDQLDRPVLRARQERPDPLEQQEQRISLLNGPSHDSGLLRYRYA